MRIVRMFTPELAHRRQLYVAMLRRCRVRMRDRGVAGVGHSGCKRGRVVDLSVRELEKIAEVYREADVSRTYGLGLPGAKDTKQYRKWGWQ